MNKRNSFVILALSAAFLLTACGEGDSQPAATTEEGTSVASSSAAGTSSKEGAVKHTVTFETNGGSAVAAQEVEDGGKVTRPENPVKMGATFLDWFEDEALVTLYNFDDPVHADLTLYAGWTEDIFESSEDEPGEEGYIYFKDAAWWNNYAPSVHVSFTEIDPSTATDFGTQMEWISYNEAEKFNYFRVELPDDATGLMFIRTYTDTESGELKYGSSCTAFLDIPTDGSNMYVLDGTEWTTAATGHWDVYEGGEPVVVSSDDSEPSGEGVTYEVTGIPTWITNDGCIIFAWAWPAGAGGAWYSCTYTAFEDEHATALTFETPTEVVGLLLVRCIAGTETPDWDNKGDTAGRIYNKTNDITVAAGVHSFEAPESIWVEYK